MKWKVSLRHIVTSTNQNTIFIFIFWGVLWIMIFFFFHVLLSFRIFGTKKLHFIRIENTFFERIFVILTFFLDYFYRKIQIIFTYFDQLVLSTPFWIEYYWWIVRLFRNSSTLDTLRILYGCHMSMFSTVHRYVLIVTVPTTWTTRSRWYEPS